MTGLHTFFKGNNKIAFMTLLCAFFFCFFVAPSSASDEIHPDKYAAFIMDADTGLILYQKNANKKLHPASLTKMMTVLMLFDALDQGKLRPHSKVRISEHAASMVPSKIGLKPGDHILVKDAIPVLITKSANDIAVAVAEKLGGSERRFAKMMTKKARSLGMGRTTFRNASGLHDQRQVSTARDMARLSRVLILNYNKYYHHFSASSFTYRGKTYRSHNRLMDSYAGMDGLKTGYISASGFNLASSAQRNNRRLIGVVFGGKTSKSRNKRMEKLLDFGFSKIGEFKIAQSDIPVPKRKPNHLLDQIAVASRNTGQADADNTFSERSERTRPSDFIQNKQTNWSRWAMLDAMAEHSIFNRMIGQGDYDISIRNRIETGLIAISSHLGEKIPSYVFDATNLASNKITPSPKPTKQAAYYAPSTDGAWAIQVGAFTSRANTNKALAKSINALPVAFKGGKATIAPLQNGNEWIYRARIEGYTKTAAAEACRILPECVIIPPNSD